MVNRAIGENTADEDEGEVGAEDQAIIDAHIARVLRRANTTVSSEDGSESAGPSGSVTDNDKAPEMNGSAEIDAETTDKSDDRLSHEEAKAAEEDDDSWLD